MDHPASVSASVLYPVINDESARQGRGTSAVGWHMRRSTTPPAGTTACPLGHRLACLIEHEDTIRVADLVGYELMVVLPHLLLILPSLADKPLQPADSPPLDVEGHRFNRLAFQLTELAYHVVKEMGARLTPPKAVVKGRLQLPELLHEPFYITGHKVKCRHGKSYVGSPTGS